jgi:hypothetical protein
MTIRVVDVRGAPQVEYKPAVQGAIALSASDCIGRPDDFSRIYA